MNEARTKVLVQRNREEHSRLVAEFNRILETYRVGLEAIMRMRRLSERELVELIYCALNPTDLNSTSVKTDSSLLNTDWSEGIRCLDLGGALKAVVTLSELPEATFASLLRPLMALDFSSEVVLNIRVPNQAANKEPAEGSRENAGGITNRPLSEEQENQENGQHREYRHRDQTQKRGIRDCAQPIVRY